MPEESQGARELRILKNIVFALPRALRWMGQNFANGVRAGMANAQEQQERKNRSGD
jgi:predicted lipid carrier protein YhbT